MAWKTLYGFIDLQSRRRNNTRVNRDCHKVRSGECTARAITDDAACDDEILVIKGPFNRHTFTVQTYALNYMVPILDYFEEYYVVGRPARGQLRSVPPRYRPAPWNQTHGSIGKFTQNK